jgi:hypothetical protein
MPDFLLIKIIRNLDKQLGLLSVNTVNLEDIATPLLNLRNTLLKEFVSDSTKEDWTIKDCKAICVLEKIKWKEFWNH